MSFLQKKEIMLNIHLTSCQSCEGIPELIQDIDCKLTEQSNNRIANLQLMTSFTYQEQKLLKLLNYKRILQTKYYYPDYGCMSLDKIISRIKVLLS